MVFESLVVELINRYLGSYIEALNASQLKIGLLRGNAQLDNLDIKANAFDDLDLPVKQKLLHRLLGSLTLKIPFKNLFTEPTIAELTGLYVLIAKEKRYAKESKQKELVSLETARLKPKHSSTDSFGEKLAAQVIKNLQISIKDIHIRYEDSFSIPNRTFSLGLTLMLCATQSPAQIILTQAFITVRFVTFLYSFSVVKPISSTAMLHIHTRPEETNYSIPQMDLVINFAEIELCFSLSQYHDITCFLEAQDRIVTQGKYRKYRPLTPISQNYKVW
ncbi:unnamed protein product [Schistosoma mattheei]|uniref:Chorein N-terminal domain-containing protein n=1 Tax=Schistosoma mattheei TaxID=31246 RepID=A0A183NPF7_9TREM|nr:unnamed protein product [Schistosoma mattheei]